MMAALSAPSGMMGASAAQPISTDSAVASEARLYQTNSAYGSYSSSPRQYPSDITDPIFEEGVESGSESPLEPVTPASVRQSQDFALQNQDQYQDQDQIHNHLQPDQAAQAPAPTTPSKAPFYSSREQPLAITTSSDSSAKATTASKPIIASTTTTAAPPTSNPPAPAAEASTPKPVAAAADADPPPSLLRRSTRGSTSSFKRTVSNLFRRSSSLVDTKESAILDTPVTTGSTDSQLTSGTANRSRPTPIASRRPSTNNKSTATTQSESPPSPGSPLEMARSAVATSGSLPAEHDFRKSRASTGLTLRGRAVNFVGATVRGGRPRVPQRASSFDAGDGHAQPAAVHNDGTYPPERLPWPLPPDVGTGAKARRMSLSLPDDFTIDVAELLTEFEYQHKILGRHGKHLGKGAASKVTLMARKNAPGELYAVKEFRGKSNRESKEDYDKKIKSEFSIAKSLHHPNIVETIRLCSDHARWNHVMEYCSEGDLFSLVQKGWLKGEDKKKDRLCLFKQLIQGVNYLHANGIAHRDIKLENLLITKDSKLKITDFGVSEVFSGTHPGLREAGGQCGQNMGEIRLCSPGICGSEPYIAPEVLAKKGEYDPRALDVWGSAIIMIYLTFGGAIWSRAEPGNLHYDKLVQGWDRWNKKHEDCDACITDTDYPCCMALDVGVNPPALRRVLLQMLNPDPTKRIKIADVLNNRWVKNIECCQVESYDDPTQMIDATKKESYTKAGTKKIFCHTHVPPKSTGSHSLGKMPGQAGY